MMSGAQRIHNPDLLIERAKYHSIGKLIKKNPVDQVGKFIFF